MEKAWTVAAFATLCCVDDKVCLLACQAFLPSLAQIYFGAFFLSFFSFFPFFQSPSGWSLSLKPALMGASSR